MALGPDLNVSWDLTSSLRGAGIQFELILISKKDLVWPGVTARITFAFKQISGVLGISIEVSSMQFSDSSKFGHVRRLRSHHVPFSVSGRGLLSINIVYYFLPKHVFDSTSIQLFIPVPLDLLGALNFRNPVSGPIAELPQLESIKARHWRGHTSLNPSKITGGGAPVEFSGRQVPIRGKGMNDN